MRQGGKVSGAFIHSLQRSCAWGLPFHVNSCLAEYQDSHPWLQEVYRTYELLNGLVHLGQFGWTRTILEWCEAFGTDAQRQK